MVMVAGYVDAAVMEELVVDMVAPGPPVHVIVVVPAQVVARATPRQTSSPSATRAKPFFEPIIRQASFQSAGDASSGRHDRAKRTASRGCPSLAQTAQPAPPGIAPGGPVLPGAGVEQ